MVNKRLNISLSTIFIIIPIMYFNSCTFEWIKHFSFVLPVVCACALICLFLLSREGVGIDVKYMLPMVGYVAVLVVLFILGGQNQVEILLTDIFNTVYLIFFMFVFLIYSHPKYQKDRMLIIVVCIVDLVVSSIYSIKRLIEDPTLSRLLSTGSYHQTSDAANARGVVSFGVVYGLVLLLLVLFYLIAQRKKNTLMYIGLFGVFTAVLLSAQFTIAIILLVMGMFLTLVVSNYDVKYGKISLFVIAIVGILGIIMLPTILEVVIDSELLGYEINTRIQEILDLLHGENLRGSDLSSRLSQYSLSISAFWLSFGMGKIVFDSLDVGGHSQFLDSFGNYGLIFVVFIFALCLFVRFICQKMPTRNAKRLYKMIFLVYVIMSIVNTSAWAPITLNLVVLVPFLCMNMINDTEKNSHEVCAVLGGENDEGFVD